MACFELFKFDLKGDCFIIEELTVIKLEVE